MWGRIYRLFCSWIDPFKVTKKLACFGLPAPVADSPRMWEGDRQTKKGEPLFASFLFSPATAFFLTPSLYTTFPFPAQLILSIRIVSPKQLSITSGTDRDDLACRHLPEVRVLRHNQPAATGAKYWRMAIKPGEN
jgi:hypothetical protein